MSETTKGLKMLRVKGAHPYRTPPTPGSATQKRKKNLEEHKKKFGGKKR